MANTNTPGLGNVWIVGASSGIGASLAGLILEKSDNVAISARSSEKLDEIQSSSEKLSAFPLDIADQAAVAETVEKIESRFSGIDLAVLCAGVWWPMSTDEIDTAKMRQAMDVNYFGVVNAVNALLPGMKARGGGRIVVVASVAGLRGLPRSVAYGPTKAALINLVETLAIELRDENIEVTIVNPGFVDTPMSRVNTFRMPGLISADTAAEKLLDGIVRHKPAIYFPFGFTAAIRLLNLLPTGLYYAVIRRLTRAGKSNKKD
ncbi:SDR family NAD(P)-dependent oxidoreductase [Hoeflea sp.]|uniref:SDR family NAD(P)-dependent oxidoreductase n=1 Tax=Hoeflea sp. TaxID=1940281 RepID=UPI003B01FADD